MRVCCREIPRPFRDWRSATMSAAGSGQSCRSVAKTFMVSVVSVVKWSQRQRALGSPAVPERWVAAGPTLWRASAIGFWRGSPRSLT